MYLGAIAMTLMQFTLLLACVAVWLLFFDGWAWIQVNLLDEEPESAKKTSAPRVHAPADVGGHKVKAQ